MSTLDKLGWAKAPRVLIVWPRHGRVLTRRLDLVLLQRNAQQRSKQIGLVTHDPDIKAHARDLGIPVFDSLDDITEQKWHRRLRTRPPIKGREGPPLPDLLSPPQGAARSPGLHPLNKIMRFVLAGIAILGLFLLAAAVVPKAEISLTPQTTTQEQELTLILDPEVEQPQPDGHIPARWERIVVEGSLRIPTTGSASVPASTSNGFVTLNNLTSDSVSVPQGTGLRASEHGDVRFVTIEDVSLPAEMNVEVTAAIQAVSPGLAGNLPIGAINAVEGSLGLLVSVTNPEATTGGTDESRPAVSSDDQDKLMRELSDQLFAEASSQIQKTLDSDTRLVEGSLRQVQILEQSYDRQLGEPADSISLALVLEIEGLMYRRYDIDPAIKITLATSISDETMPIPETLSYQVLSEPAIVSKETASMKIRASQETYQTIDFTHIRELVRGRTPEETTALLEKMLDLMERPQITISPAWFPRLPWLELRIYLAYAWETE
ncbi:MAG TPA: hypothetical protein G4O11_08305 [Anaerolineae bacterium]|nr:hypothetical protein [Anaerolineae bacterium]